MAAGVRTGIRSNPGTILQSNFIVRFNADGTIDTAFQTTGSIPRPTGGLNYIEDVTVQPDDKIIAVGGFGGFRDSFAVPPATRYGIARLNAGLTLDTTFNPPGTGPLNTVKTTLPLTDGKVRIGGDFTSVNSVAGTASLSPSLNPAKNYRIVEIETPKNTQGITLDLAATADLTFAVEDAPRLFWRLEATR